MQLRAFKFALAALLLTAISAWSSKAAPPAINPFAITEVQQWQFGFETSPDTPPTSWQDASPLRAFAAEKVVWYRLHFSIRARPRVPLAISPGRISNTDRAYLNGQLIGSTGRDAPRSGAFGRSRLYYLPTELLKIASSRPPTGENRLTNEFLIRVQGLPGESGITSGPHRIGPLSILRERALLEALPVLAAAVLLFAGGLFSLRGLMFGGSRGRHVVFVLLLFSAGIFVGLAGDFASHAGLGFHFWKRLEFIALCCTLAFIAPALFQDSQSRAPQPARRGLAIRGLLWLPAALLLSSVPAFALSDDYGLWFSIIARLVFPVALLTCPLLACWAGVAFFRRRSSDNFFVFLGLALVCAAVLSSTLSSFRLSQNSGLLLLAAGLFLTCFFRRDSNPPGHPASVSEDRHFEAPQTGFDSESVSIELFSSEGAPPAAHMDEIRLAGRNYVALFLGSPSDSPTGHRLFPAIAEHCLAQLRESPASENTYPELWLARSLSEFRHFLDHAAGPAGAAEPQPGSLLLCLLDPENGFLYQTGVGSPTETARVRIQELNPAEPIQASPGKPATRLGATIVWRGPVREPELPRGDERTRMRESLEEVRRGKRAKAIALYEELNLKYPGSESVAQNLALLHIKDRNLRRAARYYEYCSNLNPAREKYIYQAALAHYRDENYVRAAVLTERLILRDLNNLEGLLLMCELMRLLENAGESNKLLARARNIAADDPRVKKMATMVSLKPRS